MSIFQAACSVISRAAFNCVHESAIQFWTGLLLTQHGAVAVPVERALAQHVEGTRSLPDPAHAMVDPSGPEPLLGDGESLTARAEHRLLADTHVGEPHHRMTVPPSGNRLLVLERRDLADHLDPQGIHGNDELRCTFMPRRVGVGHDHHDIEVRK